MYYFLFSFRNVLVKGGDLPASADAVDVLFDGMPVIQQCFLYQFIELKVWSHMICPIGKEFYEFRSPRIKTSNTHGTGCTLASSIAAELARGSSVHSAIKVIDHLFIFLLAKHLFMDDDVPHCSHFLSLLTHLSIRIYLAMFMSDSLIGICKKIYGIFSVCSFSGNIRLLHFHVFVFV